MPGSLMASDLWIAIYIRVFELIIENVLKSVKLPN